MCIRIHTNVGHKVVQCGSYGQVNVAVFKSNFTFFILDMSRIT